MIGAPRRTMLVVMAPPDGDGREDRTHILTLDGREVTFALGETILDVARREGVIIPTLCADDRLDPAGACRTCLVEVEGQRRLLPSCATPAAPGQKVTSASARVERHRQTLYALYLADQPPYDEDSPAQPCELHAQAKAHGADLTWPKMEPLRQARPHDDNVYIRFQAEKCILCARCTRYCEEVEQVSAITLAHRGAHTTISTADGLPLQDTTCELCGGCVAVCPTGAMTEARPLIEHAKPEHALTKVRTTCNYCGVGCQMDLLVDEDANDGRGRVVKVKSPAPGSTTNDGNLCVKGRFAYDFVEHGDRIMSPLVRDRATGKLEPASWEIALERIENGIRAVREKYGDDAIGMVSSSRCTGEENYLMQKIARGVFHTNNIHQCAAT